jgi:hypothetical protein
MKKSLLTFSLLLFASSLSVQAQDCAKIFISEYVEGWSNNKALEIYNPTASPVNLAEYFVARYSNGNNSAQVKHSVQLSGTVQPYSVFVAVLDKRDPNGTGQEAPVWDSLQARADGFYSPVYNTSQAFYWNGDDAIALVKGTLTSNPDQTVSSIPGATIVDIFGKIGEQPTNAQGTTSPAGGWSTEFPYTGQNGTIVTVDHSLIRKPTVKKGVVNPGISFFDPLAEYDSIPAVIVRLDENGDTVYSQQGNPILDGNWNSLGYHQCACNPLGLQKETSEEFQVYPNPSNGVFYLNGLEQINQIQVYNAIGQQVKTITVKNEGSMSFQLDQKGMYLLKISYRNNQTSLKKIIVR